MLSNGSRSELKSRFRSLLAPRIDRRHKLEIIKTRGRARLTRHLGWSENRDLVAAKMIPAQMVEAQRLAHELKRK